MTDDLVLAELFPEQDVEIAALACPVPVVLMHGPFVARVVRNVRDGGNPNGETGMTNQ
jgi:hypothetical protein